MLVTNPLLAEDPLPSNDKSRVFEFSYGARVSQLQPGSRAKVWFPIATESQFQKVKVAHRKLPAKLTQSKDTKYGNTIGFFETQVPDNGEIEFQVVYEIQRREAQAYQTAEKMTASELQVYLREIVWFQLRGSH